jgi:hypothetical protein
MNIQGDIIPSKIASLPVSYYFDKDDPSHVNDLLGEGGWGSRTPFVMNEDGTFHMGWPGAIHAYAQAYHTGQSYDDVPEVDGSRHQGDIVFSSDPDYDFTQVNFPYKLENDPKYDNQEMEDRLLAAREEMIDKVKNSKGEFPIY